MLLLLSLGPPNVHSLGELLRYSNAFLACHPYAIIVTLLRLGMTLGQGRFGVWMIPGSPGLCQHSCLLASMRVTKVGLWKRVQIRKPGNMFGPLALLHVTWAAKPWRLHVLNLPELCSLHGLSAFYCLATKALCLHEVAAKVSMPVWRGSEHVCSSRTR